MATTEELVSMKHRMDSMEEKLEKIDKKMDMLTEKLLDPDYGVTSRVNRNTAYRKVMSKALCVIYAVVVCIVVKMFWG